MGRDLVLGGMKSPLSTRRLGAVRFMGGMTQVSFAVLNSSEEAVDLLLLLEDSGQKDHPRATSYTPL